MSGGRRSVRSFYFDIFGCDVLLFVIPLLLFVTEREALNRVSVTPRCRIACLSSLTVVKGALSSSVKRSLYCDRHFVPCELESFFMRHPNFDDPAPHLAPYLKGSPPASLLRRVVPSSSARGTKRRLLERGQPMAAI